MARGFESKDVEYQQSLAERPRSVRAPLTAEERDRQSRRRSLELALAQAESELAGARSPAHRRMLEQAMAALKLQIGQV